MKRASLTDRVKAYEMMKPHIVKHEDGTCSYIAGWDDKRISAAISGITVGGVEHVRREMFGQLRSGTTHTSKRANERIDELWTTVKDVSERLAVMEGHVLRLIKEFGLDNKPNGTVLDDKFRRKASDFNQPKRDPFS